MTLKEYIEILSKFDQTAEVLKMKKYKNGYKQFYRLKKSDIREPHVHFCYNEATGGETLVNSLII